MNWLREQWAEVKSEWKAQPWLFTYAVIAMLASLALLIAIMVTAL